MDNASLDAFALRAADQAMRSAINYLVPAGTRPGWTEAQVESLLIRIREEVETALPSALSDARDAFSCGMGAVAGATFGASMTLAGTRAAKAWDAARNGGSS